MATKSIEDAVIALRDELWQWKLALGWWSGLPAQEAFDFWKTRRRVEDPADQAERNQT